MMVLANAGSVLERKQRHKAFPFSRADISKDGCDYDVFLLISWECKLTGKIQSRRKCSGVDCFNSTNR